MFRCSFLAIVLVISLVGCSRKPDAESIQGSWKVSSEEREGKPVENSVVTTLVIGNDQVSFRKANDDVVWHGTFVLHPDKSPNEIDIALVDSQILRGIYKISGDKLTLCWSEDNRPRPPEFSSTGKRAVLLTLKRE